MPIFAIFWMVAAGGMFWAGVALGKPDAAMLAGGFIIGSCFGCVQTLEWQAQKKRKS